MNGKPTLLLANATTRLISRRIPLGGLSLKNSAKGWIRDWARFFGRLLPLILIFVCPTTWMDLPVYQAGHSRTGVN
jgi:hypothetical protein